MSVLTSVGILLLSMLIMAFLQLSPGVFTLLIHYTRGKFSKNKASDLATFYILGAETAIVIIFLSIYYLLSFSPIVIQFLDSEFFAWFMFGLLVALSIFLFFFYYRAGAGSKLYISRKLARKFHHQAETVKTRSDAFALGLSSLIPELAFTFPIFILAATTIMRFSSTGSERACWIILFVIISVLPLLIIHNAATTGRNLADFARFRFKNKNFFRWFIAIFYLLLAILTISEMNL